MEVKSTAEFVAILEERSVILGPPSEPGQAPRMSSTRFLDEDGCRRLLYDIEKTDIQKFAFGDTYPTGHLAIAKEKLQEAEYAWEYEKKVQAPRFPDWTKKHKEPYGRFAEDINRCKATIIILEREAVVLRGVIEEADKRREANERRLREASERLEHRRRNV